MSKHFRPWNIDQTLLLPPSVQDFVPKDHVSRFIVGLVRESLDLKEITRSYVSGLGQPPFDPRMMVALLPVSYTHLNASCATRFDPLRVITRMATVISSFGRNSGAPATTVSE